ncbi:ATP-binding protein [Aliarcobacter cryaerophilus]|uniref:ATP-binding protein n=4 Tax=Arcobacteraceae TaxID=2808963 RepID=A0AA96I1Q7_9BACT|nr:ATP-binding protein [Arcobacter sp. AZ-2023]WPD09783.1 ATP-binding protein [Arcobacter sp. DSM 115954]WNL14613.1 ATP-binding protein [Arcobacter sp. AZ-2023]WNL19504.1 ATP-binding protein [Arcobacter sp. AZ-2023]WNL21643.1 ATP-binding protein [Arcobacter sp. AZ-2023]
MSSLYSQLSVLKDDEDFFLNSRTNKTIKEIQKELNITIDEAMVLSIIMSYQIQDTYSTSFDSLKKDFKLQSDEYLKYLNIAYKLEKKGFIALAEERRRGRSSRISPEFNVDDMIFNKLILGYDYLDDVDFSDIYSVVKIIAELIYKKDDKKLTEFRLVSEANRVFDKLDIKEEFTKAILKYSTKEKLLLMYLIYEYIDGNSGERANRICEIFFDDLSHRARYLESILKEELDIFKDKLVQLEERSGLFDSSTDIQLTPKAIALLLQSKDKNKKQEFKAQFTKHIKFNTLKKEIFLDERVARDINQLKDVCSSKNFNKIVKDLKKANLPSGIVSIFYGFAGTGKTASVYEIAKLTKRDVLQVDISSIQSKWVGESEKNTKAIFDEYYKACEILKSKPILLFNEADAIISKRLDVNDAVSQMNNTMQNILLEELENFDGIFMATTNLIDNMDDAFSRRFLNKIKFDRPTAKTREHIWKSKLPELEYKIYEKLSKYDLSGGQIENVTRKYLINKILNQKGFDFDEILEYIKEEISFKNDDNSLKVGFLK